MIDQIWIYYLSLRDTAQELHGFLVAAGLLFLILVAVLWNCVISHFVKEKNLIKARKASALFCLIYSLLRAQTILRDGTNALLETAIHVYLLYHITYPLFISILLPTQRLRRWIGAQWYQRVKPSLKWLTSRYVSRKDRLKQKMLAELNAPELKKQRTIDTHNVRTKKTLDAAGQQLAYELDLQYTSLPDQRKNELPMEAYQHLRNSVLRAEDISTMQDRASKLKELLISYGSDSASRQVTKTSRIHEIGSEFAEQREQINATSAYDQRQKDHLNTFLNRLEGVELENYLKEKIHGVSHKPRH